MNPLGVNVSDVWSDIYPVRHKNSKNRKYNELSVKLLDRVISMSTNEGDTVFDPFAEVALLCRGSDAKSKMD